MGAEKELEDKAEKAFEEEEKRKAKIAKRFDPMQFVSRPNEVKKIYDEELGEIQYTDLTIEDSNELTKVSDDLRSNTVIWMMLRRVNPDLKVEDVGKLPQQLLKAMTEKIPFFYPAKKS